MLHLYDLNHVKTEGLTKYKDYNIERNLDGIEFLSFLYSFKLAKNIKEETYIRTKENEYIVKEIDDSSYDIKVVAKINLEELQGKAIDRIDVTNTRLDDTVNLAIAGTGYTAIILGNKAKRRTTRKAKCSALDVLEEIRKVFRVEFRFDTINKIIYIYDSMGEDKGSYFSDELNLRKLNIKSNTYDFATRLIPIGKNGLTIESINNGKKYVENYQYSNKIVTKYWEDNRYTVVESLKEDAIKKLDEMSKRVVVYNADVYDLAKASDKYNILEYSLGDTIELMSRDKKIKEKQRIVKLVEYPEEPERNTCEIANKVLRFEDMQKEVMDSAETTEKITNSDGSIDGTKVDSIDTNQINEFSAEVARITNLSVINADIANLKADKADINDLNAAVARIGTLEATKATITELEAAKARITTLETDTAKITDLNATNAKIDVLEADNASINDLLAGNLTAENFQAGAITAGSSVIAVGAIGSAQISDLSASKLSAGTIDAAVITVKNLNADNITVGSINGQRIANGAIDNSKVADNANISGNKLDIDDVIVNINGATTQIDGTKIQIGNKTLDIELSEQKISIGDNATNISNNTTSISANASAIALKLDSQTFNSYKSSNDGKISTIESNLSKATTDIQVLQGEILLKAAQTDVNTIETNLNNLSTEYTSTKNKVATLELDLNSITQRVTDNESNISSKAEKTYVDGQISTINTNITNVSNRTSSLETSLDGITGRVESVEQSVVTVNDKVDGIEVGGRNLFQQSNLRNWADASNAIGEGSSWRSFFAKVDPDQTYSLSRSSLSNNRFRYYLLTEEPSVGMSLYGLANNHDSDLKIEGFKTNSDTEYILVYLTNQDDDLPDIKLEKGNIATDWTPAPEDVEQNAVSRSNSHTDSKVAEIKVTTDAITQRVSSAESNISTINGDITSLDSRLDSAELKITPGAITSTVESNTTTLAKNSDLNTLEGRVTTAESNITQNANQIALKVNTSDIGSLIEQNADSVKIAVGTVDKLKSNGMEIRDDLVNIHTNQFSLDLLDANGDVITNITAENQGFKGLFAEKLRSPSVVQRHVGDKTFYVDAVNGNDENSGESSSQACATIEGILEGKLNHARHLDGLIKIEIISNYQDTINLDGYTGKDWFILDFNNNDFNNALLSYSNNKKIIIRNAKQRANSYYCIFADATTYLQIDNLSIFGDGSSFNVYSIYGSNVRINNTEMYDASQACLRADNGSTITVQDCKGKADKWGMFAGYGSLIAVRGTAPGGASSNSTEYFGQIINTNYSTDYGLATPPPPPPNPEVTSSFNSNYGDHYKLKYSSWDGDGTVLQGDYGYGNNKGCWFFPSFGLAGKTIISAKLKLTRKNNSGYSSSVPIYLYSHGYSSRPGGNPSMSYIGQLASFKWGETKTINLPSSVFAGLVNGSIKGFGIYTSDTSNSKYIRMDGSATLTVTYK